MAGLDVDYGHALVSKVHPGVFACDSSESGKLIVGHSNP